MVDGRSGIIRRRSRGQRGHATGMGNWTRWVIFDHFVVHANYLPVVKKIKKNPQLGYLPDKHNCDIPHVLFVLFPPVCSFGGCELRQIGAALQRVQAGTEPLAAWRAAAALGEV